MRQLFGRPERRDNDVRSAQSFPERQLQVDVDRIIGHRISERCVLIQQEHQPWNPPGSSRVEFELGVTVMGLAADSRAIAKSCQEY